MPAANAQKVAKMPARELLSVITDPTRWRILECLDRQKTAKEVGEDLDIQASLAQYHLKQLLKIGLVSEFSLPDSKRKVIYERRKLVGTVEISDGKMVANVTRS